MAFSALPFFEDPVLHEGLHDGARLCAVEPDCADARFAGGGFPFARQYPPRPGSRPFETRLDVEQGVSRSQVKLTAHPSEGRVLVGHKQGAINGIRIVRWSGSPGVTPADRAERRANPAAAAKTLRAGQLLQVTNRFSWKGVHVVQIGGQRFDLLSFIVKN